MKIYVGVKDGIFEVFKSDQVPTRETHGELYSAVIGPFRTMRGARYIQSNESPAQQQNHFVESVANAERAAIGL